MAKLLLSAPLAGIRGSVGASVFSSNRSGPYLKIKSPQRSLHSVRASSVQTQLSSYGFTWAALSSAQRTLWDSFGANAAQDQTDSLGQTYSLSGYQWYVKINLGTFRVDRPTRTNPPVTTKPIAPVLTDFFAETVGAGVGTRVTYMAGTFAGRDMVCFGGISNSPGRIVQSGNLQAFFWRQVPGATSQVFEIPWRNYFSDLVVGQRAFVAVYAQRSDGYRSDPTLATADVVI